MHSNRLLRTDVPFYLPSVGPDPPQNRSSEYQGTVSVLLSTSVRLDESLADGEFCVNNATGSVYLPLLLAADSDNILAAMVSATNQRYAWSIEQPIVGLGFADSGDVNVHFGWPTLLGVPCAVRRTFICLKQMLNGCMYSLESRLPGIKILHST